LDYWIYCTLYMNTVRAIQYMQYSAIAILHTFQLTVPHALGFSVFTSRILATDLSQSHWHFRSHMASSFHRLIPFLAIILQLPIPKTRVDYSRTLSCTPLSILNVPFYKPLARTLRKLCLLFLIMRVYWSITYQWMSFNCCFRLCCGDVYRSVA
jgi:hypothetical protein